MRHSVQPRDEIFVKVYGFLSFAENIGKNIRENVSKNLRGKYSQKFLDHARQSAADTLKTISKKAVQNTAEATGDLIGTKIADTIIKIWKNSQENDLETITNKHNKEIPKERYLSPEERQNFFCDLKLI